MKLEDVVTGTPYAGYLYSYPHKTAYRALEQPVPLDRLWSSEDRRALFLYVHVPFCEMRCGFCNLFTSARPRQETVRDYLAQLSRQASVTRAALGEARFARFAIGGGTPTYLEAGELVSLFQLAERFFDVTPHELPTSVETSPETATRERLDVLAAAGVERLSIGVQSFLEEECRAIARPQPSALVHAALDAIRSRRFKTLNIDLMYGLPGQTAATFLGSIEDALRYQPEELYLYPLYVRPLTGLGRMDKSWDDQRLHLYRVGRERLLGAGYRQVSMRMFRLASLQDSSGPVYCCQTDGMIGLGPGARSYTSTLHYSTEFAVSARGVKELIAGWNERDASSFALADHGIALDGEEQRRRFAILSLLADGLDLDAYRARFAADALVELPELLSLLERGLAERSGAILKLADPGVERADAIGPYLWSSRVRERMAEYPLR